MLTCISQANYIFSHALHQQPSRSFDRIDTNVAAPPADDEEYLDLVHEMHLIIPNAELNAVLVVPGDREDRVAFPVVEPTIRQVEHWRTHPQDLQQYVYEKLCVRMRVMFRLRDSLLPPRNEDEKDSGERVDLVCQLLDHEFTPSLPLRWFNEEEIFKHAHLRISEDPFDWMYSDAELVLKELKGAKTALKDRELWHKITWLPFISQWTRDALEKEGYELISGPVSINYGTASHTMGCKARRKGQSGDGGDCGIETLYIKATLPNLEEVRKTVAIARECPEIAGEVIAWDLERGLMILRDVGSPSTYYVSSKAVFGTMRKLQSLSKAQLKRLRDGGLHVRDARWYLDNIEGLIDAATKRDIFRDQRIFDALQYLAENVETMKEMIRDCNKWNLPNVLVHGDLHPGNYGRFVKEGNCGYHMLFDWDRAFIGSPLSDVSSTLCEKAPRFEKDLMDDLEELDMPWKPLIPEGEWSGEIRNAIRAENVVSWCDIFWYYLHAHECQADSFVWRNMRI